MDDKICSLEELKRRFSYMINTKFVFTNGCFDILHIGHIRYLKKARELGDYLIVAINTDEVIRNLKGDARPINSLAERLEMLSILECVDFVTFFNEADPYDIINELRPDILVKGGDWKEEDIIGADIVKAGGGEVMIMPYVEGTSTTNIIKKIRGEQ